MKPLSPALLAIATLGAALAATHVAAADSPSPDEVIRAYCEPLVHGEAAKTLTARAQAEGFRQASPSGKPMLMLGEVLLGLSDAPRACAVQAPKSLTPAQGFALVDAWGKRHPGAQPVDRSVGPDGSPVRAWTAPEQKMALTAVVQTNPRGDRVVLFIMQPL